MKIQNVTKISSENSTQSEKMTPEDLLNSASRWLLSQKQRAPRISSLEDLRSEVSDYTPVKKQMEVAEVRQFPSDAQVEQEEKRKPKS